MDYGRNITVEVIFRDETGRKIDKYKWTIKEQKVFANILLIWKDKYGLEPDFDKKENIFDV